MLITNAKKTEGEWDFDLQLRDEEVDYLVNFAVANLLQAGTITVQEKAEQQEVDLSSGNETLN